MNAYAMDLRCRVWSAWEKKEGSRPEIARRFEVSVSFVRDLIRHMRDTQSLEPRARGGGARRKADARAQAALQVLVAREPDATLAEYAQRLARELAAPPLSPPTLCRALQALQLTRKKSSSTPASATKNASRPGAKSGRRR